MTSRLNDERHGAAVEKSRSAPGRFDTGSGMTLTVAFIALIACREVHASPDALSADVTADFFYPVTPTKVPATLVIGTSDGRAARRVAPTDAVEVVHTTVGTADTVTLVTTEDSIRLMEGPQLAGLAEQVQYWTGAKLRKVGDEKTRTQDDVTEGPETLGLDPKAPTTMPYWQYPVILGGLDKKAMDDVVWANSDGIRACVKDNESSGAARGGLLAVKFNVAKTGAVSGAQVRTTTVGSPAVEQCVVDRFKSMEFRAPKGGGSVIATYSMILTPVP